MNQNSQKVVKIAGHDYILHEGHAGLDFVDDVILETLGYMAAYRCGLSTDEVFDRLDVCKLWVARPVTLPNYSDRTEFGVMVFFDDPHEARFFCGATSSKPSGMGMGLTFLFQGGLLAGKLITEDINGDGLNEFGIRPAPAYLDDAWVRATLKAQDAADRTPVLDASPLPTSKPENILPAIRSDIANRFSFDKVGAAHSVRAYVIHSLGEHFLYLYSDDPMSINDAVTSSARRGLRLRSYTDRGAAFSYKTSGQGRYYAKLSLDPVGPNPSAPLPEEPVPPAENDAAELNIHERLMLYIAERFGESAVTRLWWSENLGENSVHIDSTERAFTVAAGEFMARHGYALAYCYELRHGDTTTYNLRLTKLEQ